MSALFIALLFATASPQSNEASTLFSSSPVTVEDDRIQVVEHAIITITEELSQCDGIKL